MPRWRQNARNEGNVGSSRARRSAAASRPSRVVRTKSNWRRNVSRVPICACCRSIATHASPVNSWRRSSATSSLVIVPSKSESTARSAMASGAFRPGTQVGLLRGGEGVDAHAHRAEREARDGLVDVAGDVVDARFHALPVFCEVLRAQRLDREAHVHDLHGVALTRRKFTSRPSPITYTFLPPFSTNS